jgi:hypothetical protein
VPRNTTLKIGLATAAAAVGAILAITSAFAHGTPTTTGRSLVGTIVNTAAGAAMTSNDSVASTTVSDEATSDAIEAAELAAKIAAEQAAAAAAAAAKAAEEAAEATPPTACVAADQAEDTAEKAADQTEDAAEKTNGSESATEDSNEKTAAQATDTPEDATEVPCPGAEGDHHSEGAGHEGSATTLSSTKSTKKDKPSDLTGKAGHPPGLSLCLRLLPPLHELEAEASFHAQVPCGDAVVQR